MLYVFKKYSHNVFPYPCTLDRLLVLLSAKRNFRIWSQLVVLWAIFTKIYYILIVLIFLVASVGLEPTTPTLSDYGEIRTLCYLYHNQTRLSGLFCRSVVLYLLSYETYNISKNFFIVGRGGFEPPKPKHLIYSQAHLTTLEPSQY